MTTLLRNFFVPQQRLWWHLFFWLTYWIFFSLVHGSYMDNRYAQAFEEVSLALPVIVVATYFTLYALLPLYLLRRKYLAFFIGLFLSALCFGLMQRAMAHFVIYPYIVHETLDHNWIEPVKILKNIISIYSIVLAAVAVKLMKIALRHEYERQTLEQEKLKAELKFLKSQIHPHFLFNTLNNLYALTLTNSAKASEIVLKLSNLLDYMLFQSNDPTVPLAKEISFINNYIALEKLRYGDQLEVTFRFTVDDLEQPIPPLILLPFVENSLRHGVSDSLEPMWMVINLEIKGSSLTFKVENSKSETTTSTVAVAPKPDSISLENIRRRLNLLFTNRHHLQLLDSEEVFLIILTLELDKKVTVAPSSDLSKNRITTP